MIVPKAHILSYGAIDATSRDEFSAVVHATRAVLGHHYGPSVILEHGTSAREPVADHVTHAHLHIVPAAIDIRDSLINFNTTSIASFFDLTNWAARDEAYIYFESCSGDRTVAYQIDGIARLFIRSQVARQVGLPDPLWDWRRHILSDNLHSTVETLRQANWRSAC